MQNLQKTLVIGVLIAELFLLFVPTAAAAEYPKPVGYVNDFAHVMNDGDIKSLENELRVFENETTNEVVVVTVSSLNGMSIEDYALGLANEWGVGKKGKDNGVVLLVAPNERKVRIEVGKGLDGTITNGDAQGIIDRQILPEFKKDRMSEGIVAGTHGIIAELNGSTFDVGLFGAFFGLVIAGFIAIALIIWAFVWTRNRFQVRKDNILSASKCQKDLEDIKKKHPRANSALEKIKAENPRSVWSAGEERLDKIRLSSLSALVELAESASRNFFLLSKAGSAIHFARSALNEAVEAIHSVLNLSEEIERLRSELPSRLKSIGRRGRLLAQALEHEDVSAKTRKKLAPAMKILTDAQELVSREPTKINWRKASDMVEVVDEAFREISELASSDKKTAKMAREKGPELLKKMPRLLDQTERRFGKSSELAAARGRLTRAQGLYSGGSTNWLAVWLILSTIQSSRAEISSNYSSGYSSSYSSSRSSYGSGGYSGGFSGFGGGSFGGGGASGGW